MVWLCFRFCYAKIYYDYSGFEDNLMFEDYPLFLALRSQREEQGGQEVFGKASDSLKDDDLSGGSVIEIF